MTVIQYHRVEFLVHGRWQVGHVPASSPEEALQKIQRQWPRAAAWRTPGLPTVERKRLNA